MGMAIDNIRQKGIMITENEAEAAIAAILLHDIGHGPFSHSLEESIITDLKHEDISEMLMNRMNEDFGGRLETAISIYKNRYHKKFLHQLVSGQLDMDRMDYLMRDSFYTGVAEGIIGTDRIIKMLNVSGDELVVESKGIYSIEKFLIARRIMYWQVYFHKTVIAAENLLLQMLKRAKYVASADTALFSTDALGYFLRNPITKETIDSNKELILNNFINLDDDDIMVSAKAWANHPDEILSMLSGQLTRRVLPKVRIQENPFSQESMKEMISFLKEKYRLKDQEIPYLLNTGIISNNAYSIRAESIKIIFNNGEIKDLTEASDLFRTPNLTENIKKYFLWYPKEFSVNC